MVARGLISSKPQRVAVTSLCHHFAYLEHCAELALLCALAVATPFVCEVVSNDIARCRWVAPRALYLDFLNAMMIGVVRKQHCMQVQAIIQYVELNQEHMCGWAMPKCHALHIQHELSNLIQAYQLGVAVFTCVWT